jgi:hypothetical protein
VKRTHTGIEFDYSPVSHITVMGQDLASGRG